MGLKDTSEKVKRSAQELREEVRDIVQNLGEGLPRPLMERHTLILKEPLMKQLRRRREEKKFLRSGT